MPDNQKPGAPVEEERRVLKNVPTAQLVEELCNRGISCTVENYIHMGVRVIIRLSEEECPKCLL